MSGAYLVGALAGALTLASTTSVALWFERRRGLAIGISSAAGAAVMSLAPLVLSAAIDRFDWRLSWSLAGLAVWAVVVPIAWWGLRDRPADVGQRVDGDLPDTDTDVDPVIDASAAGWTRAQAMRTLMFWTVTAAVATSGMITTGLAFHQISLLGERGLTVAQAAATSCPRPRPRSPPSWLWGRWSTASRLACSSRPPWARSPPRSCSPRVAAPGMLAIAFGVAVGAGGG